METDDISKLATFIRNKGYCRIGIDGTDAAGKSTMAGKLSKILGLTHLNLDDFFIKESGRYLDYLKYNEIRQQASETKCFVVEGVCLLNVLEKIDTPIDCLIYVKRMRHNLWADERECEITEEIEVFISKEKELMRLFQQTENMPDSLGLAEEIIRYHYKFKPHKKADLIYTRVDC